MSDQDERVIDQIVAVNRPNELIVNNSNRFQRGQKIEVWTSVDGFQVCFLEIESEGDGGLVKLKNPVPVAVAEGMILLIPKRDTPHDDENANIAVAV